MKLLKFAHHIRTNPLARNPHPQTSLPIWATCSNHPGLQNSIQSALFSTPNDTTVWKLSASSPLYALTLFLKTSVSGLDLHSCVLH
jgi:hypothetical protein